MCTSRGVAAADIRVHTIDLNQVHGHRDHADDVKAVMQHAISVQRSASDVGKKVLLSSTVPADML